MNIRSLGGYLTFSFGGIEMRELNLQEISAVSAGINDVNIFAALSIVGGTLLGGGIGTVLALNMAIPTASLLPVWIAACAGAGGAIGSLAGIAFTIGGSCFHCSNYSITLDFK